MKNRFRIAVFSSGSGSNFQAIVDAVSEGRLDVSVELLICDKTQAQVVKRAHSHGIPAFVFQAKDYSSKEQYETDILGQLLEREVDLVVLAGYMRIISATLLQPFAGRIINIHPSLLPAFPGANALGQALAHGVKVTGVTVHLVDGGMDTGPIIAQRALDVAEGDTQDMLEKKIHAVEHVLLPQVIGWIREDRLRLDGRKVAVIPQSAQIDNSANGD